MAISGISLVTFHVLGGCDNLLYQVIFIVQQDRCTWIDTIYISYKNINWQHQKCQQLTYEILTELRYFSSQNIDMALSLHSQTCLFAVLESVAEMTIYKNKKKMHLYLGLVVHTFLHTTKITCILFLQLKKSLTRPTFKTTEYLQGHGYSVGNTGAKSIVQKTCSNYTAIDTQYHSPTHTNNTSWHSFHGITHYILCSISHKEYNTKSYRMSTIQKNWDQGFQLHEDYQISTNQSESMCAICGRGDKLYARDMLCIVAHPNLYIQQVESCNEGNQAVQHSFMQRAEQGTVRAIKRSRLTLKNNCSSQVQNQYILAYKHGNVVLVMCSLPPNGLNSSFKMVHYLQLLSIYMGVTVDNTHLPKPTLYPYKPPQRLATTTRSSTFVQPQTNLRGSDRAEQTFHCQVSTLNILQESINSIEIVQQYTLYIFYSHNIQQQL